MFFERIKSSFSSAVSARGRVRTIQRQRHVMIINDSVDEIAVLGAVLRRRGFTTSATRGLRLALRQAQSESPDVIIIDENAVYHPHVATEVLDFVAEISSELLVLGKLPAPEGRSKTWIEITKPYHYDTLVRKISCTQRVRYAA